MSDRLGWGILGTGTIARTLAHVIRRSPTSGLIAIASRNQATADKFGSDFELPASKRYGDYDALLADKDVQAVYVATPHTTHADLSIRAMESGKHVLVEKPIAMSEAQSVAVIHVAIKTRLLLLEGFMYRFHPQTQQLVDLIKSRAIGDVKVIQATNSFYAPMNARSRLYDPSLGGGSTLDIGCYPVSMARLLAGAAIGISFADPIELRAVGFVGDTGVDHYTVAALKFTGDIMAQISAGIAVEQENVVRIFGTEGRIVIPNPWMDSYCTAEEGRILIFRKVGAASNEIMISPAVNSFACEIEAFNQTIFAGEIQAASPAMTWADSLGNMRTLDQWRDQIQDSIAL